MGRGVAGVKATQEKAQEQEPAWCGSMGKVFVLQSSQRFHVLLLWRSGKGRGQGIEICILWDSVGGGLGLGPSQLRE